ncbi:MAG TPA: VacJ family lipoprotein [Steroidobacteraceae bacterium]|nr:VacJ family lipoprotein [Steroidobacteraceae bacterium]
MADRAGGIQRGLAAAVLLAALPAVAAGAAAKLNDPLEKLNRATYAFNDALDRMLARPAARAYKAVVPTPARNAVSNFFGNLYYPVVVINQALQGKFRNTGNDAARFIVNTVVGVGGFFDPATHWGLANHDEDFGQTLGWWGVPAGPYLVLPVLGPSDFRDAPAKFVDRYLSPTYYQSSRTLEYGLFVMSELDKRTQLLATDAALAAAFDPYTFVRNAYVTRREYLVHDGNVPEESYDDPIGKVEPGIEPVAEAASENAPPASPAL